MKPVAFSSWHLDFLSYSGLTADARLCEKNAAAGFHRADIYLNKLIN